MFKLSVFLITILFLTINLPHRKAFATCINFESNCYACDCATPGCSGNQLCYGEDSVTGETCNVSQSCNVPQNTNSCDCSGQVGNYYYNLVSCGDPRIKCIGELGANGTSRACHYCVTPLAPTGSPPPKSTPLSTPAPTYKTTSNTVVVPGKKVMTSPAQSAIVDAASTITPLLRIGEENLYNTKIDEPGVYYWCTYLAIDSYNKAGLDGLTRTENGTVLSMKSFFASTPGYILLAPSVSVEHLSPGNVIFFEGEGQHASLIKSMQVDENGNGAIRTFDANNIVTEDVVAVRNYQATKAQTTSRIFTITGFGQVAK